jgi:cytochrome c peroxidase
MRETSASVVLVVLSSVLGAAGGCQSSSASNGPPDASSDADPGDRAGSPDGNQGDGACETPAAEDLYPHFDFSTDDGTYVIPSGGSTCVQPPADGGTGPGGPGGPGGAGGPGGPPGGPPDGGGPAPANDGGSVGGAGGGTIGNVLVGPANAFGRFADQRMPDVALTGPVASLDDFARTRPLGTNGRHCETCHGDQQGWTTTPSSFQERFNDGITYLTASCSLRDASNSTALTNDDLEPIFRTHDATNSPRADVSTPEARRTAYSMLLTKALIRIGLPVPNWEADYELVAVDDPYGFASANQLSLFRRSPLMANLRFNTTIMWDGRETLPCATLTASLRQQAKDAITGHAQGAAPSDEAIASIVRGELGIYSTQFLHIDAGPLHQDGAHGGPTFLAQVPFYRGINAFEKTDPQGHPYSAEVFTLYAAWRNLPGESVRDQARRQIAEGERLFDTREFTVSGVSGFNDELGRASIAATCGACHNAPNVGTSSEGRLMDLGVSDEAQRTPDLPLYTFREKATGAIRRTSDPGQALITKTWAHMNRFKVPILRSLAVRPPYFHNGSAGTLAEVVAYHDQRFGIGLSPAEQAALVAFLSSL